MQSKKKVIVIKQKEVKKKKPAQKLWISVPKTRTGP